jgi:hypothetical protein
MNHDGATSKVFDKKTHHGGANRFVAFKQVKCWRIITVSTATGGALQEWDKYKRVYRLTSTGFV